MARGRASWTSVLKANPTDWLLEPDNPVVRFWALRDLVDAPKRRVEAARRQALEGELAAEVFRQQKPEGHWESPGNMHAPHYTATIYQLTLLGNLGATAEDDRVLKAVRAVLQTQREDGGFPGHDPARCPFGPYDIGLIIRFMHQFGLGADRRVKRMFRWVKQDQTREGGWTGTRGHCEPAAAGCLNASANVLWGLATAGTFAGTPVARKGIGFLAKVTASSAGRGREFSYPQCWNFWVDDVKLAEIYLGLGVSADEEPLKTCWKSILTRQGKDGRWLERMGPYPEARANCKRMRAFFPQKGQPSKWVSAKAMIVLKQALAG